MGRQWRFPRQKIDALLDVTPRQAPAEAGESEPEMDAETRAWEEANLEGDLPPYEWGEVDPLNVGRPVRYVAGVGLVIEDEGGGDEKA